jgi:hypothetical protein
MDSMSKLGLPHSTKDLPEVLGSEFRVTQVIVADMLFFSHPFLHKSEKNRLII